MKLDRNQKVVCICRGGQVRSVSARFVLADKFGFRKVLACGWEKNDVDTVTMLCNWADVILVVGRPSEWVILDNQFVDKTIALEVGPDRFGHYGHPELVDMLTHMIKSHIAQ